MLVKLQKTRELYRLPSAEELGPLVVSAGDPAAVDTVNGRIGDICVMLVCMMVGTRWQGASNLTNQAMSCGVLIVATISSTGSGSKCGSANVVHPAGPAHAVLYGHRPLHCQCQHTGTL